MSDPIEELIEKLRHNREIDVRVLTSNALHNVGEVFELDGFGATRLYLLDKQNRPDSRAQATALLHVLDLMRDYPAISQRRAIGRALFKSLIAICQSVHSPASAKGASR